MRPYAIIGLLAAAAVAALLWSQKPRGQALASGIIEAHDIRVGSRVGGRVHEVHADEGQRVHAGDVLVTLEPYDLRERLSEAQASRAAASARSQRLAAGFRPEEIEQARAVRDRRQAAVDRLVHGPRPLEIQILENKLALARADFRKAEADQRRMQDLEQRGTAMETELTEKARNYEAAQARLAQAADELALAREGTRAEELAEARALLAEADAAARLYESGSRTEDIAEAQAQLDAATARSEAIARQIEELKITAPSDAAVESIALRPGDLVAGGAPVVTLIDTRTLWVRIYVPERMAGLESGRKLRVRVDSVPGREFAGHVTFVSREAEFIPSNSQTPEERSKQVFRVKVELDEGHDVLRPGMIADVILE
jgi:HlyD family secretion protein